MKLCALQELCLEFTTGDNKPKNNDVRNKMPCSKWVDMSCDAYVTIYFKLKGEYPSCNIKKRERLMGK